VSEMPDETDVAASIRADIGEEVEIHDSSTPDAVFVTSRSRIELALQKYQEGVLARTRWVNPFVMCITILSVLLVADFKSLLGLSAAAWYSVFVVALLLSIVWLGWAVVSLVQNRHKADPEFVIEYLESE
jgi:hypothetical protein